MPTNRIVLVDDHQMLLDAIKRLVEPEFNVVATFNDCFSLLENVAELGPDVVVIDVGMPGMNGLTAGEHVKKLLPKCKLIT